MFSSPLSIGAWLADFGREAAPDLVTRAALSTVHAACCVGLTIQSAVATSSSLKRAIDDGRILRSALTGRGIEEPPEQQQAA